MPTKLEIIGLAELRAALRNLAPHLRDEAQALVFAKAEEAKATIVSEYHEGPTGNLRRGVTLKKDFTPFGVSVEVRSRAPHAWLYEHGSKARHYYTVNGVEHLLGSMPARPTFEPIMARKRRELNKELIALIEQQGLTVVDV